MSSFVAYLRAVAPGLRIGNSKAASSNRVNVQRLILFDARWTVRDAVKLTGI
jgi:hypothetical protein